MTFPFKREDVSIGLHFFLWIYILIYGTTHDGSLQFETTIACFLEREINKLDKTHTPNGG